MYPVFCYMVRLWQLDQVMAEQFESLESMFKVLDLLLAWPNSPADAQRLRRAIVIAMRKHKQAYSENILVPKWHTALHIPFQIQRRGRVWATFVQERKHKAFKRYATSITNLGRFEMSVTLDLVNAQLNAFNDAECSLFATGMFLMKPVNSCEGHSLGLPGIVSLAKAASINMVRATSGDVVFFSAGSCTIHAGRVIGHVLCPVSGFFMLLHNYKQISKDDVWEPSVEPASLVPSSKLLSTAIWCSDGAGIHLIRPGQLHAGSA